jgi:aconitate hydratase
MKPRMSVKTIIHKEDGSLIEINLNCRIDTLNELDYYKNGRILQYVMRCMLKNKC